MGNECAKPSTSSPGGSRQQNKFTAIADNFNRLGERPRNLPKSAAAVWSVFEAVKKKMPVPDVIFPVPSSQDALAAPLLNIAIPYVLFHR